MIYTVTFNPSLDYIISVENFNINATNRTSQEVINAGGKGVNVSIMLANLGMQSIALGFCAGFTGNEIKRLLKEFNIENNFIEQNEGLSRINVKLKNVDDNNNVINETEINGMGPKINEASIDKFYSQIDLLKDGDILVLAGSIPSFLPDTIYKDIMIKLQNKNIKIVVDATKDLLTNVLEYKPFLIKPNNFELEEIFNVKINTEDEIITYAKKLHDMGASNVLISMADKGAILIDEDGKLYMCKAPKGQVKNSVGSGDSMVAGFIYGYLETNDYKQALSFGICAGSASAFSEKFATKKEVLNLIDHI